MVLATRLLELPVRTIDGAAGLVEDVIIRERDWSVRAVTVVMQERAGAHALVPRELVAPTQKNTVRMLPLLVTLDELGLGGAQGPLGGIRPDNEERAGGTSLRALLDYRVRRQDGEEARLREVVLDPRGWHVRRLVTGGRWWPFGSDQRFEPRQVRGIDHDQQVIELAEEEAAAVVAG